MKSIAFHAATMVRSIVIISCLAAASALVLPPSVSRRATALHGVSAKEVQALRKESGAGMMDCKKALVEADGDVAAATEW